MVETPPVVEAVNDLIDLHEEHQGIAPPDTLQELATPEEVLRKVQEVLQYLTDVQEATIIPEKVNPDGEGFDVDEIYRQIDEAKAIAALAIKGPDYKPILIPPDIEFGNPTETFSSGTTITLVPCNQDGTVTGQANVTLYLLPNRGTAAAAYATIDVLSFYRFGQPDSSGVHGVLLGTGAGLLAGSGQYKVLQLDGDNAPAWDYVRFAGA